MAELMRATLETRECVDATGARYLGAPVEAGLLRPWLGQLSELVGDERMALLQRAKDERDGPGDYHLTVIAPPEYRPGIPAAAYAAEFVGLGRQSTGEAEAYYVVVSSADIDRFRIGLGLRPRDLHVTLGFWPGDIYDRPKGAPTLIGPGRSPG